tara:strand:- start:1093 stop:1788 length:696 start_codon:yes stop_codon:yes gene_type:complete
MTRAKIGVILAGCGVYDGSEIHETTLTLLALDKQHANVTCLSIDKNQHHTINHSNQTELNHHPRNCLIESSRIARGPVIKLNTININDFDAFIFPGGFGVAKNLCSYAIDGANHTIEPEIEALIVSAHNQKIPMGFLCISPVIPAKLIPNVKLTIGTDPNTINDIETMGAQHIKAAVSEIVTDNTNYIVSTPAYMLATQISELSNGINQLVKQIIQWSTKVKHQQKTPSYT